MIAGAMKPSTSIRCRRRLRASGADTNGRLSVIAIRLYFLSASRCLAELELLVDDLVLPLQSGGQVGHLALLPPVDEFLEGVLVDRAVRGGRRRVAGLVLEDVDEGLEFFVDLELRRLQRLLGGRDVLD